MSWLNDLAQVAAQYTAESNLVARRALYEETEGEQPSEVLWRTIAEWHPKRVLEVGGGPGELSVRMQAELGARVAFVDISPRMVELARGRGIDAQVGDVQELPFEDGSFDTVVAAWMLYHVPDLDKGLAELARVLVDGGALIAVTNSVEHLSELRELMQYERPLLPFSRENGEESLRRHFRDVQRYDTELKVIVRQRETLVGYAESITARTLAIPEDVSLPFVTYSRPTIFFATT